MAKPRKQSTPATSITEQIRAVIAARGLTPYAVAKAAGLQPSTLTRFVNRERLGSAESLDKVCEALGLKLTEGRGGLR